MTIRTKYITTKSKESFDENKILLSIDGGGDMSLFHMKNPTIGIMLYADQVKALLEFLSVKPTKGS